MGIKFEKGDSNKQTNGWAAMLTWPGMLWWLLPVIFLGAWGMQNWMDGIDQHALNTQPGEGWSLHWWWQYLALGLFACAAIGFVYLVIKNTRKKSN